MRNGTMSDAMTPEPGDAPLDVAGLVRHPIERPEYRNNGEYQFVKGYTGGGAEMCVHLNRDQISSRCEQKLGPGTLVDDGVDLWWEQPSPDAPGGPGRE
jgi:hypothetical protein